MIELITNKPVAIDSLDHINPYGCIRDNNSFNPYIMEVKNYFNKKSLNVLDMGCAGGQIIIDHVSSGDIAVGLEGSSHVLNGTGQNNWKLYKDKNLFLCDITDPFLIKNDQNLLQFDYIQMWEVLEHIPETKLNMLFNNIANHLSSHGLFCGSIATYFCSSGTHVSVFDKLKWKEIFKNNGFEMTDYIFSNVPRQDLKPHLQPNYPNGFVFTAKKYE